MTALQVASAGGVASVAGPGAVVTGSDHMRARIPRQARVLPYDNYGYSLRVLGNGEVTVEVELEPLRSSARFDGGGLAGRQSPAWRFGDDDPVARLARSLVAGERLQYGAVSRLLSWVGRNIIYELNRDQSQEPIAVLERRAAYCTGIARLTVALLTAVGIEAREVPGYVFGLGADGASGYHRWVEIYYTDRGWVFSDPLISHHYVPASYVRLASDRLDLAAQGDSAVLLRSDDVRASDLYQYGVVHLRARANSTRRRAGALRVTVEGSLETSVGKPSKPVAEGGTAQSMGEAVLDGAGLRRRREVLAGRVDFVALEDSDYELSVRLVNGISSQHRIRIRGRELSELLLPMVPNP